MFTIDYDETLDLAFTLSTIARALSTNVPQNEADYAWKIETMPWGASYVIRDKKNVETEATEGYTFNYATENAFGFCDVGGNAIICVERQIRIFTASDYVAIRVLSSLIVNSAHHSILDRCIVLLEEACRGYNDEANRM